MCLCRRPAVPVLVALPLNFHSCTCPPACLSAGLPAVVLNSSLVPVAVDPSLGPLFAQQEQLVLQGGQPDSTAGAARPQTRLVRLLAGRLACAQGMV